MRSHVERSDADFDRADAARLAFDALMGQFGPLLPSSALPRVLGYPSPSAFRQAVSRGTVPVRVFKIPSRRGWFALAADVARWVGDCQREGIAIRPSQKLMEAQAASAGSSVEVPETPGQLA